MIYSTDTENEWVEVVRKSVLCLSYEWGELHFKVAVKHFGGTICVIVHIEIEHKLIQSGRLDMGESAVCVC